MQKGTVTRVRPTLSGERLRVVADVVSEAGVVEATMPDREVAAILPRSVLVGAPTPGRRASARVPVSLLGTIGPILTRMAEGRVVRIWDYNGRNFFSFLPWKSVRFVADAPPASPPERLRPPMHQDPEGDGHVQ